MKTFFLIKRFLPVLLALNFPFSALALQPTTSQRAEQVNDPNDDECPICFEKKGLCSALKRNDVRKVFSCTHWICEECYKKTHDQCPICRAKITEHAPTLDNYLWQAVENNDLEKVRKYIRRGAHPDISDPTGKTLLLRALWNRHLPMAKVLILNGANVNAQERHGFSALHKAAIEGHAPFVDFLLEHGARIDLQDNEGNTALHYAVANDHKKIIEVLIKQKSQIIQNKARQTALDWAEQAGNAAIVQRALAARK